MAWPNACASNTMVPCESTYDDGMGCWRQVVVKSQILAGGRGLGTFKGGLKGGVHIVDSSKALEYAKQMLGDTLVTKQTGPAGKPVGTLFIASKLQLTREMYFAILLDRKTAGECCGGAACDQGLETLHVKACHLPAGLTPGPFF